MLSYTSLRYLREPLAGLFLGILKYMGHSLTKSRLSSNIDFPDIGNAVRNRMSTVQRQQCLEVECGFKFLLNTFIPYLAAQNMVKWGVPEKILQNAVQTH